MWVSIASDAACAAALQQAVFDFGVVDTDTLQAVLQIPETAAGLARALCTALQAAPPAAEIMTDEQADEAQVNVGTQTSAANGMVDISVAEAMISEALCMVDEAQHREQLAGVRARSWEDRAEFGATLLRAAEERTDCAQAARQAAERSAAAERAAKQMAEHMLAAEAALWRMLRWRALGMSAQRAVRQRHKGIFGRRLLRQAGVVEVVEAVVGKHHHRHRRRLRRRRHPCLN